MPLIALLLFSITLNWIFHQLLVFLPLNLLALLGKAFWIGLGVIVLLFVSWSFPD